MVFLTSGATQPDVSPRSKECSSTNSWQNPWDNLHKVTDILGSRTSYALCILHHHIYKAESDSATIPVEEIFCCTSLKDMIGTLIHRS